MKFSRRMSLPPAGMQLAAMMDVLFVLIIFFVVTMSYARFETEIGISVPAVEEGKAPKRNIGEIVVNVRQDGTIVVNSLVLSSAQLLEKLEKIRELYPDQAVILRGDTKAEYGAIAAMLDICQKAGIWNVAFATKEPEREQKK